MLERLCLMETTPLQERFAKEAFQLRVQARNTPPSVERYLLVRKARRAETAFEVACAPPSSEVQSEMALIGQEAR